MKLLIDVGNTRIKWACYDGAHIFAHDACARSADILPAAALDAWQQLAPQQVWLSSVASQAFDTHLAEYWQPRGSEFIQAEVPAWQHLLPTKYRSPSKLGVDRWLAMLAAWRQAQQSVCVAVCGTALTIDWVDGHGIHQGGVIVPGWERMQASLQQAPGIAAAGGSELLDPVLGLDTQNGLRLGAEYALAGAIEQVFSQVQAAACYISGGNGELVAARMTMNTEYQPDLVLQGLAYLAKGDDECVG